MKITLSGVDANTAPAVLKEIELKAVQGFVLTDPMLDLVVDKQVVRISAKELEAAARAIRESYTPPWTITTAPQPLLYGPNGTGFVHTP